MNTYEQYASDMILRDHLAADRTSLANERTLLAYIRTFIGFFSSGGGVIAVFSEHTAALVLGIFLAACGVFALVFGIYRFFTIKRKLKTIYGHIGTPVIIKKEDAE